VVSENETKVEESGTVVLDVAQLGALLATTFTIGLDVGHDYRVLTRTPGSATSENSI
jgi:hypothetical protein